MRVEPICAAIVNRRRSFGARGCRRTMTSVTQCGVTLLCSSDIH